ncbi:MAG TPA: RluA family pseudouridine synthase [Haliangium sp.]|nr:RluA family pseudouridine synthase [Haliangium sp.]
MDLGHPVGQSVMKPGPEHASAAGSVALDQDGGEDVAPELDLGLGAHLDENGQPRVVERRFVVDESFAGFRLDHYLKRQIPRLSRTRLQAIIRDQLLPVRGRRLKPSSSVALGDEIVMRRQAQPEPPCPRTFEVLYEDAHMMVIDKPAGLPVHASARFYFNTLTRVLEERFPGQGLQICHRLDRETSGVLVVARGKQAAARLKGAFEGKRARKTYLAVVWGDPPWPDGAWHTAGEAGAAGDGHAPDHDIDLPLGLVRDPGARIDIRMEARPDGLPSLTRVRVLERRGHAALVRCSPVTGRQHQIRAHLAACGHPIVGDKLYAHGDEVFAACCDQGVTPELLARLWLPRHALHAAAIVVPHPATRHEVRVESPLPADLRAFLDRTDVTPPPEVQALRAGRPG